MHDFLKKTTESAHFAHIGHLKKVAISDFSVEACRKEKKI